MNLQLMLAAAVIVGIIIWFQIKKIEPTLTDEGVKVSQRYLKFASEIKKDIDSFKNAALNSTLDLKEGANKEKLLEEIEMLDKELEFITITHKNLDDKERWEGRLFHILTKLEEINTEFLNNYKQINEAQKERLGKVFASL